MKHSLSCSFPEGCDCGASAWNELEAENADLRKILTILAAHIRAGEIEPCLEVINKTFGQN